MTLITFIHPLPANHEETLLLTLALACSFCFGYAFKNLIDPASKDITEFKRVTGIGGIFSRARTLPRCAPGIKPTSDCKPTPTAPSSNGGRAPIQARRASMQWSPFKETTKYFEPSTKEFMINYRVADMDRLVEALRKEGVTITDSIQTFDYGGVQHILDLEGNKIELWEPNDVVYEQMGIQMSSPTTK